MLSVDQFVAEEAERYSLVKIFSQPGKTLREQRTKGAKDAQPRDTLRIPSQRTKTNRSSLRNQRFQ